MEHKKIPESFSMGEVDSMFKGLSLVKEIQCMLSQFWRDINDSFVSKSEAESLIRRAVQSIKCELEDGKEMLTISETAEYLQTSKSSVYKMTSSHQIPFYKPNGKTIYILRQDLIDWVKKCPCKSEQQIEAEADAILLASKSRVVDGTRKQESKTGISDVQMRNRQLAMEIRRKYSH